jgi:CRP-like cAMP-binding protein
MTDARPPGESQELEEYFVEYPPGQDIFREGDPTGEMFIVQEGRVAILKQIDGAERELALLGPGEFFGETSILAGLPRSATARADTRCRLLRVEDRILDAILLERPEIAAHMLRIVALRLREYYEAVLASERAGTPVPEASVATGSLLHLSSGKRFPLSSGPETSVGRADPATGRVPFVDLAPVDSEHTVSRFHAKLLRRSNRFVVRDDTPSTNGTFVDGERVSADEERPLRPGSEIRFGGVVMRLEA